MAWSSKAKPIDGQQYSGCLLNNVTLLARHHVHRLYTCFCVENKGLTNLMHVSTAPAEPLPPRAACSVQRARDIALCFPAPGPCVILPEIVSNIKLQTPAA
jgi:hypothetical protein